MVFQIPTELWGWQGLRWHYLPFFLLPAAASMFCIDFLGLRSRHPRLFRMHLAVIASGVLLSPVAVFALPWANLVASMLISAWMVLTLVSGYLSLRSGYRPARFFVLAFTALALPALIILPGNLDLIPDLVDNAEAWTLFGSAVEALLQAFALADRIRLLGQEKDRVAEQLIHTLQVAHTDAMTGLGNRYAFDLMVEQRGTPGLQPDEQLCLLAVIDLDGLKQVNDRQGHARGDDLIRAVGRGLGRLQADGARCYRLGGDEFAILALRHREVHIAEHLMLLELELVTGGFDQSGISYGIAHWEPGCDPFELLKRADGHMYENKARRKAERLSASTLPAGEIAQRTS
jgi:diguanylate cyclase (GGDEF)-like protein